MIPLKYFTHAILKDDLVIYKIDNSEIYTFVTFLTKCRSLHNANKYKKMYFIMMQLTYFTHAIHNNDRTLYNIDYSEKYTFVVFLNKSRSLHNVKKYFIMIPLK